MLQTASNNTPTEMLVKAFWAKENPELCEKYALGHEKVLKDLGIPIISSADRSWFDNPDVVAIIAIDENTGQAIGGARIQFYNKEFMVPMVHALIKKEPQIVDYAKALAETGSTAEICGLWNALDMRGTGLSAILTKACIAKAGVALARYLGIDNILVFCASYTKRLLDPYGFEVVTSLGDNGRFFYPTSDYISYVTVRTDAKSLNNIDPGKVGDIKTLRQELVVSLKETGTSKGEFSVKYDLKIENPQ